MFNRIQIRTLLACAFILFFGLLIAVGASGIYGIRSTNDALKDVAENVPTLKAIDQQLEALARARMRLDRVVDAPTASNANDSFALVSTLVAESDQAWRTYQSFPAESDEKRIADHVDQARSALVRTGIAPLLAALQAHDQDTAHQLAFERLPDLYVALNNATADLAQYQFDNSVELLNEGKAHERATLMITLAVTVAGFISAAVMWITLTHAISKPLAAATRHFKAIESGDLTSHITIERADELGSLLQSLATMQEGLRQTVSTIRQGVDLVVDAADEVATGNADLSGRTERQAASLEETAANMEELSATVKHNTSHALEASTLARSVGETASQGAEALQRVLDTMNLLKQGSGKIADITSVIEGIAFQTNILALNAAVEAARAGETGRGFAVVASEVRALAQRSGSAAKEIKDLLDASVSSVRDGATQATEAGGRMNATLDALQRVTSLINEVADASQEQARSVEQVTTAISQMDEVTQQNAALVEQAATASDSMREQATTIRTVVARFRTTKSHASTGSHDASMQTHASTGSYASISKHA